MHATSVQDIRMMLNPREWKKKPLQHRSDTSDDVICRSLRDHASLSASPPTSFLSPRLKIRNDPCGTKEPWEHHYKCTKDDHKLVYTLVPLQGGFLCHIKHLNFAGQSCITFNKNGCKNLWILITSQNLYFYSNKGSLHLIRKCAVTYNQLQLAAPSWKSLSRTSRSKGVTTGGGGGVKRSWHVFVSPL